MKNTIKYFYNLYVSEFKRNKDFFILKIEDGEYIFMPFHSNIERLYNIYSLYKRNNVYCHELIQNKSGSLITDFNNKDYILIKKVKCANRNLNLGDILDFDLYTNINGNTNWKELWSQKMDYYEYQISQLSFKYPILKESFNYYLGMTETAILLLNYIDHETIFSICHDRIRHGEKLEEFLNPADMIIDSRIRDIAEYIKNNFMHDNFKYDDMFTFLKKYSFNNSEVILLLARLLYPSYYFDMYDLIIQGKIREDRIYDIVKKNTSYEVFLKKFYMLMRQKYIIPEIEWLQ